MIRTLVWDSIFFGYPVGEMIFSPSNCGKNMGWLSHHKNISGFKLLYLKIENTELFTDDLLQALHQQLQNIGANFVSQKVYATLDVKNFNNSLSKNIYSVSPNVNKAPFYVLAMQAALHSRFYTDTNFTNNECKKMYTKWVNDALSGEANKISFATADVNDPDGFIVLSKKTNFVRVDLIVVKPNARRMGVGKKLLAAAKTYCVMEGCNAIELDTQLSNIAAVEFYAKEGFEIKQQDKIYHLWVN